MVEIRKLLIIGVGMIGGSLAIALRKAGVVQEVVGAGRTEKNLKRAVELDVIDRYTLNFEDEVSGSDVIVIATPVLTMESVFQRLASTEYHNSIITDVGSVKKHIVDLAEQYLDSSFRNFVPAHPIAGREHVGVEAATDGLFKGKKTIVTPTEKVSGEAVEKIKNMWTVAGTSVEEMEVEFHDKILSASSHLPHIAAFGLVHYIANHKNRQECFGLAASGFYDFTRIASSDPTMWSEICQANAPAIIEELNGYIEELKSILERMSAGEAEEVEKIFEVSKASRDYYLSQYTR